MASRNAQLADAVVAALNGVAAQAAFVLKFTAIRRAVPVKDLATLKTLRVTVIDAEDTTDDFERDGSEHLMKVFIGVEKLLATPDPSAATANLEVDPLKELVEQIDDFDFGGTNGVSSNVALFDFATIRVLSDPPSMLTQNVFRGVVEVNFIKPVSA